MKSLRFSISSPAQPGIAHGLWQLCQTLWVGAHLAYLLLFVPVLRQMGLAPLLVSEVDAKLWPGLLVLALMGQLVQGLVLLRSLPAGRRLGDARSLLLLLALASCLLQLAAFRLAIPLALWGNLAQGVLLGSGLLLLMQATPAHNPVPA
ncbi:MAG: hypothetical protein QMB92_06315 [Thiopseudomonas sp.]